MKQAPFIRKNTKELREFLINIGLLLCPCCYDFNNAEDEFLYINGRVHSCHNSEEKGLFLRDIEIGKTNDFDCGENEELFKNKVMEYLNQK